jgi:hypothetical protein
MFNTSFLISIHTVKTKNPFPIGENLIMPCLVDACKTILDEKVEKRMTQIPLSNNMTVRHFIKTKNCFSSIQ